MEPRLNTTGNKYKLLNHTVHCDIQNYSFSARTAGNFTPMGLGKVAHV